MVHGGCEQSWIGWMLGSVHILIDMVEGKLREDLARTEILAHGIQAMTVCGCATAKFSSGTSNEDIVGRRVEHPVVAFAWVVVVARNFDKALIKTQVVTNGILPSLFVVPVVCMIFHDVLVNTIECQPFSGTLSDGHHDKGIVAERWFLAVVLDGIGIIVVRIFVGAFTSIIASRV